MRFNKYLIIIAVLLTSTLSSGKIIYVDDDANGANDGSSWQNAYVYLQDALTDANSSEKPVEIRVAQGIYKPDKGTGQTAGDREATFKLISGVTLSGGYAGIFEPEPNEWDYKKYETILSGDLAGNDVDISGLSGLQNVPTWGENSYHVTVSIGTGPSAILDGFTITAGHANGEYYKTPSKGGGMYNENSKCTIVNCKFLKNTGLYGAGIYNNNSQPSLSETSFEENFAYEIIYGDVGFGGIGGGMYNQQSNPVFKNCIFRENINSGLANYDNSSPDLIGCLFIKNQNRFSGAGIRSENSTLKLTNCRFEKNEAGNAGAMKNTSSNISLNNCIFLNNSARGGSGGAIANERSSMMIKICSFINNISYASGGAILSSESNVTYKNCIFNGNKSRDASGGAILSAYDNQKIEYCTFTGNRATSHGSAIYGNLNSIYIIKNSIFWSNYSPKDSVICLWKKFYGEAPSSVSISYSNIKGYPNSIFIGDGSILNWKEGNIDIDPLFADMGYWDPNGTPDDVNDDFWVDGDYHLKSQAGRFDPNTQTWVQDDVTSPCIDAGDPNSPIGLEPFPNGGRINMGAYGGTSEASKSYFGKPVCETIVAGDINGDCKVDIVDLEILLNHWLEEY